MALGYRESTDSGAAALRDLRERGLDAPLLAVGDGALDLWAALRERSIWRPATSAAGTTAPGTSWTRRRTVRRRRPPQTATTRGGRAA